MLYPQPLSFTWFYPANVIINKTERKSPKLLFINIWCQFFIYFSSRSVFRLTFRFSRRTSITADEKNLHGCLINLRVLSATQMGRSCWFYMAANSVSIHVIGHMTAG